MSDFGTGVRCKQCGTDDSVSDKLGWLELRYEHVPEPQARFCGGLCAAHWLGGSRRAAGGPDGGAMICPRCAGTTTILIQCNCGWRSCQSCPYEHPHAKPGWTRL